MATEKISFDALPQEKVSEGISRWVAAGSNMSVAKYVIKQGTLAPLHRHPHEQVSLILEGRFRYTVNGREVVLGPGEMLFIAPDALHGAEAMEDTVVIDFFSPPRADMLAGADPLKKLMEREG